ncbi:MAG TPA: type 4a pilus biogenesis protein PilO [Methylomirabilota bacterium]|nr:type 4a pilus biogenesis protein PilO [Methylomirabilota bacterium]
MAALVGAAYVFLISPIEHRIDLLSAEQASLQRELVESRRIVADLERFRREIAELQQQIDVAKEKLPTEKDIPPLYRTLSDAAFQSGLGVALFQPRDLKVGEYFTEIPIAVNVEGGYHQLGEFFERVAGLPRVVNVVEWRLSGLQKGEIVNVKGDLILATYMYRPVGSPAPAKPAAPAARPAAPR